MKYPIVVVGHWKFAHIILYYYCKLYSIIFIHLHTCAGFSVDRRILSYFQQSKVQPWIRFTLSPGGHSFALDALGVRQTTSTSDSGWSYLRGIKRVRHQCPANFVPDLGLRDTFWEGFFWKLIWNVVGIPLTISNNQVWTLLKHGSEFCTTLYLLKHVPHVPTVGKV